MSDFDKEAERERLREKYEKEEEDRAVTERMSELLLQGATMTNAHCSDCADPIFRYDGQEFCPTCEKVIESGDEAENGASADEADGTDAAEGGEAGATAEPDTADDEQLEVKTPSDKARVQFGADASADAGEQSGSDRQQTSNADAGATDQRSRKRQDQQRGQTRPGPGAETRRDTTPERRQARQRGAGGTGGDADAGDLGAAHASLTRTTTRLARLAEESEDLGRTRDLLSATREAAEALAAVREATR